jgi:hypothetical protein
MIERESFVSDETEDGNPVESFPGSAAGGLVGSPPLPDPTPEPGSSEWFRDEHGISMNFVNARPYRFWRTSQELIDYCDSLPVSQAFVRNVAEQSPTGIIIERSFGGETLGFGRWPTSYLPELRPDKAVRTKGKQKFWHCHPSVPPKFPPRIPPEHLSETDRKKYPKGKPLTYARPAMDAVNGKPAEKARPGQIHKAEHMRDHIDRDKFDGDHAGVNNEHVHYHLCDPAKYIFFPNPRVNGEKVKGKNAQAVDVNPLMRDSLFTARRIYFGIEGCIKADSIGTQIVETGQADYCSVVSSPSVTLWGSPELDDWIRLFGRFIPIEFTPTGRGTGAKPEVVIVPDADAYDEGKFLVRQQALFFRTYLRRKDVNAIIAAPPCCDFTGMHANCVAGDKCKANGVDDFLARGGTLEELVVLERELPVDAFDAWELEQRFKYRHRIDRIRSDRRFLEGLSMFGSDDGAFKGWLPQVAKATGLGRSTAYDIAHRLMDEGTLRTDKPLDLATTPYPTRDGGSIVPFDFEDPVTFTIPEELRCAPDSFRPLGPPAPASLPLKTLNRTLQPKNSEGARNAHSTR